MYTVYVRHIKLSEIHDDRPTFLLLNGGGQPPYTKFHRIVKVLKNFEVNLVAIELPGHGRSSFSREMTAEEMLHIFSQEFSSISSLYHQPSLFGFSLGGMLALKAIEYDLANYECAIIVGTGMIISDEVRDIMLNYTTEEFFVEKRWLENLKDYHQDGWKLLLNSIHKMLSYDSEIFADEDILATKNTPIHLIIGDRDEVVDYRLHQPLANTSSNIDLHVLEKTKHFDYFFKRWDQTQSVIRDILNQNF